MDFFEKTIIVQEEDLDDLNHVNNVRYVEWIQDISREHWEIRAPERTRQESVWVVMSHNIEYRNEARLGDEVVIKTYIAETKGAISVRAVEMKLKKSGKWLVESRTKWCLLNASSLKPMRISEEIRSLFKET